MDLVHIIVVLIVVGVALWLINNYVPMDGKMIDVPVDVRARLYLEWADRVQARDDEKAKAHQ